MSHIVENTNSKMKETKKQPNNLIQQFILKDFYIKVVENHLVAFFDLELILFSKFSFLSKLQFL